MPFFPLYVLLVLINISFFFGALPPGIFLCRATMKSGNKSIEKQFGKNVPECMDSWKSKENYYLNATHSFLSLINAFI